jgi:hypothetical protein
MMLEATIDVQIKHVSGPVIVDGNHVRRWLTAGLVSANIGDGFDFEVCSGHSNPNDCPADCGRTFALYRATIIGADWKE